MIDGSSRRLAAPDAAIDILARTLWGEARGEGTPGMTAVACVVLNRLAVAKAHSEGYWWGNTVIQVCQKPQQFSCWNHDDPNREKLLSVTDDDDSFAAALQIARAAVGGHLSDVTGGATHYCVTGLYPAWLRADPPPLLTAAIGHHSFYRLVPVPRGDFFNQPTV